VWRSDAGRDQIDQYVSSMTKSRTKARTRYDEVMQAVRGQMTSVFVFSLFANLLLLTMPIYMLQVYDRVLSSGSVDTLIWLTLIAIGALLVYGGMEQVRKRILTRIGAWIDRELSPDVVQRGIRLRVLGLRAEASTEDVMDLRNFYAGEAVVAFLDAPWMPVFIALIWFLHPVLGLLAIIGALLLFLVAVVNDWLTRSRQAGLNEQSRQSGQAAEQIIDSAETISTLGMTGPVVRRWTALREPLIARAVSITDLNARLSNLSRTIRLGLQIAVLGIGAALILRSELTAGGMIAASVILSRALAPVERAITAWRSFVAYRTARRKLADLYRNDAPASDFELPRPKGQLVFDGVRHSISANAMVPTLKHVSFRMEPGEMLGVIGPSGSGKSTLCRIAVGALRADIGTVRLDGADIATWAAEQLGPYLGYVAQEVDLLPGTVAENIARMSNADSAKVVEAARLVGAHEMILKLPEGYDTQVGPRGRGLSGGQRQRIALARAVFGNPSFIAFDEPNSNLDGDGEIALWRALVELKRRGTTILLVAHQPSLLRVADRVLVLRDGQIERLGPRDEVLKSLVKRLPAASEGDAGTPQLRSFPGGRADDRT
jgi:ATP-binding cassette subfamily C exporter for protease/lipase